MPDAIKSPMAMPCYGMPMRMLLLSLGCLLPASANTRSATLAEVHHERLVVVAIHGNPHAHGDALP